MNELGSYQHRLATHPEQGAAYKKLSPMQQRMCRESNLNPATYLAALEQQAEAKRKLGTKPKRFESLKLDVK